MWSNSWEWGTARKLHSGIRVISQHGKRRGFLGRACPPALAARAQFIGGKPDTALHAAIYAAQRKQRPVAEEGELEGCRMPRASAPVL